jgi:hypothetical protein
VANHQGLKEINMRAIIAAAIIMLAIPAQARRSPPPGHKRDTDFLVH